MKSVATLALKSGMVLACDVYSYQNVLIAKEGDVIDERLISKLTRYSIMCVDIKEAKDSSSDHPEHIRLSQTFKSFESIYLSNLNAYKYMIDCFLKCESSLNPSYLLTIHDNVKSSCKSDEELIDFLYHLKLKKEDYTYAHLLNTALLSSILGKYVGLNSKESKLLILCGFLFDIGKLKMPANLVWKTTGLTTTEQKTLQTHTIIGYHLLKDQNINEAIKICALNHHTINNHFSHSSKTTNSGIDTFSKYINLIDIYEPIHYAKSHSHPLSSTQVISLFNKIIPTKR